MHMDLPILEFDPEPSALIEPSRVIRPRDVPEHCVICFFQEVIEHVIQGHSAQVIVENRWEDGPHPLYEISYQDRRPAFFHPGVGAALSAGLLEEVIAFGCRRNPNLFEITSSQFLNKRLLSLVIDPDSMQPCNPVKPLDRRLTDKTISKGVRMSRKVLVSLLVVGALAITSVVGVAAYQTSQAVSPALRSAATALSGSFNGDFAIGYNHLGMGGSRDGGAADEYLAQALGITTDELSAAYQKASAAAIAKAVEDGLITQAQADSMNADGRAFPFGGRGGGWLAQNGIDFEAFLADALGISTDELQAARQEASNARLEQAVADGQITQEQVDLMKGQQALYADQTFTDAMKSVFDAAVQDAVSRGVITQAQADLILEKTADGMG